MQDENWSIKDTKNILNQIEKIIRSIYNNHIINITQLSISSDNDIFINIKNTLDKLNNTLKKKLSDLYDLKYLLNIINLDLPKSDQVQQRFKNKKIINNDIYIEEFSN